MTCKVTFGSPVTPDRRVCSLVISVIAPTTVAVDQAGVGVGLVSEAGEPWRFHVSNVQAAVESLGVTVEAAALQGGYATPDDAVRTLEDLLHVHDWMPRSRTTYEAAARRQPWPSLQATPEIPPGGVVPPTSGLACEPDALNGS